MVHPEDSLVDESFHPTSNPHLFGQFRPGGPFSKVAVVTGPEKFFFVFRIYIQYREIDSFEIQLIKISGNATGWTGF